MRSAILVLSLVCAAPGVAQQPVDESLDEEGRALFAAGRAAFGAERFDDALEHFQAAYDRSRRPELLYNVALAADRLGRIELALETYEKYLDSVPNSPFETQATERVAALRTQMQSEPPDLDVPDTTVPIIDTSPPARDPAPVAPDPQPAPPEPDPEPRQPEPDPEPTRSLRVPGFVMIGGGAAALIGGLALIGSGIAARTEVEETRSLLWTDSLQSDYDAATRRTATGIVLGAVGVAAAAAGLLMLVLGPRDDSVALDVGPTSLSLRGRF